MKLEKLTCEEDVVRAVDKFGFLPFFACGIPGFSVEEATPPEFWFVKDVDGPWEWKEHLSSSGLCAYGKFFSGRAGYVSRELLPHFINYRRDGYDFDARFDDELASFREKELIDAVQQLGAPLSHELREYCGYIKDGKKGFETLITRLQMKTYLIPVGFEYKKDRRGKPYGWGIARYAPPEALFGCDFCRGEYRTEPQKSFEYILSALKSALPKVPENNLRDLIK